MVAQVGGILPGGVPVKGISGGEKRRLHVCCAIVAAPSLIFLDEPTSGTGLPVVLDDAQIVLKGPKKLPKVPKGTIRFQKDRKIPKWIKRFQKDSICR